MKQVKITDFLSDSQIVQCVKLKGAKEITEQVIRPNIKHINRVLGQENDPKYLGYMVEFVISKSRQPINLV